MTGPGVALTMLAEMMAQARTWAGDGLSEAARREARAYEHGLWQACYLLTGVRLDRADTAA